MTAKLLTSKLADSLPRNIERHCPRGHAVKFGKSPGGMIVCVCTECIAKTGVIYRGHGLTQQDSYLRFLLAVASW